MDDERERRLTAFDIGLAGYFVFSGNDELRAELASLLVKQGMSILDWNTFSKWFDTNKGRNQTTTGILISMLREGQWKSIVSAIDKGETTDRFVTIYCQHDRPRLGAPKWWGDRPPIFRIQGCNRCEPRSEWRAVDRLDFAGLPAATAAEKIRECWLDHKAIHYPSTLTDDDRRELCHLLAPKFHENDLDVMAKRLGMTDQELRDMLEDETLQLTWPRPRSGWDGVKALAQAKRVPS